jgi:transposase
MEKGLKFFLGMDVSKLWVDIAVMKVENHERQPMLCERFDNNTSGMKDMDKWLRSLRVTFDSRSLLVIENTGVYHRLVWQYCTKQHLPIYIGNAAHIKWSLGIARGKNDKVDSQRLCSYAAKNADELKATAGLDPVFLRLKDLYTSRSRLLGQINSIKVYLGELKGVTIKEVHEAMVKAHQAAMDGLKESLKVIDNQIDDIIKGDSSIKTNYDLLTTVPGIGRITALYLICCTDNFIANHSGKQLASYAGVAPFGYQSGTSIKAGTKFTKWQIKN